MWKYFHNLYLALDLIPLSTMEYLESKHRVFLLNLFYDNVNQNLIFYSVSDDEQLTETVEHANEICLEPIRCVSLTTSSFILVSFKF